MSIIRRILIALTVSILSVIVVSLAAPSGAQSLGLGQISPRLVEAKFVWDINRVRQQHGLEKLEVNNRLAEISRDHSEQMMKSRTLSHNLRDITDEVPSDWEKLGQNVGRGGRQSSIQDAFVNSPTHFKNLINSQFTSVGVGVKVDNSGNYWVTENFMK